MEPEIGQIWRDRNKKIYRTHFVGPVSLGAKPPGTNNWRDSISVGVEDWKNDVADGYITVLSKEEATQQTP